MLDSINKHRVWIQIIMEGLDRKLPANYPTSKLPANDFLFLQHNSRHTQLANYQQITNKLTKLSAYLMTERERRREREWPTVERDGCSRALQAMARRERQQQRG
jgi:hypothetical protein